MEEYKKIEMAKRKLKEELLEGVLSGKLPESAIIKVRERGGDSTLFNVISINTGGQ